MVEINTWHHTFFVICATHVDSYAYFQGSESEVGLHQQTGHFDILVRHVAHVDLKQSRLKTQLEVMRLQIHSRLSVNLVDNFFPCN